MKTTITIALLCAALLAPGALAARDVQVTLGARGGVSLSKGYVDHFDSRGFVTPVIGLGFEVIEGLFVEAAYGRYTTSGTIFGAYDTSWSAHDAIVSARWVWKVTPWLRPFARLAGGVLVERYTLEGPGLRSERRQVGFEVAPLGGIELLLPTKALLEGAGLFGKATAGIYLEVGFRYARPFAAGGGVAEGGAEGSAGVPLELGSFDTQGVVFGGGVVGHF